jgi:hypothetical protein
MKAHRTDGVSLTFGLIFLGIVAWWLVAQLLDLALPAVGWFLAGALILIGMLGLLGALRSHRAPAAAGDARPGPASAASYEPTSGAPAEPTSGAPAEPTSRAPAEPTSGAPAEATSPPPYEPGQRG